MTSRSEPGQRVLAELLASVHAKSPVRRYVVVRDGQDDVLLVRVPRTKERHFYIRARQMYRDEDHPDGPSSTPDYVRRGDRFYPGEGHAERDVATHSHFRLRWLANPSGTTVRPNQVRE
jgi:hypothetical protein